MLLLGATALGLWNVYGDNTAVEALAVKAACGAHLGCSATRTGVSRSPISQSFTFQLELTDKGKPKRGASLDVECKRAYVFLGDYSCVAPNAVP